jgi:hypothetical protein
MAQYRPFAIWDGESSLPSGITRNQNILIGVADQEYYNLGGFDWWAGADESLGYVIAYYDPTFSHPNPLNIPCGIGFLRSDSLTESSFLLKVNQLRSELSLSDLSNANDAKTWLLANGYWTSYGEAAWTYGNSIGDSGAPSTGGWLFYSDEGQLNANPPFDAANIIFLTSNGIETYNPNHADGANQLYLNRYDGDGIDYGTQFNNLMNNGGTISLTQNGQTATYTAGTPNQFQYNNVSNGFLMINASIITQTASTDGPFVYGDPITISFS